MTKVTNGKLTLNAMTKDDLVKILADGNPEMHKCSKCGDMIKSVDDIIGLQSKEGNLVPICNKHSSYVWSRAMTLGNDGK